MNSKSFHIALIEDDPIMGESLLERLKLEGFNTQWFTTMDAAYQSLKKEPFHIIISDICLPDGNGAELLPFLKQQSNSTEVIFITAYGEIDQAVSLLKQGARDYLTKPLEISRLLDLLNSLFRKAGAIEPGSASRALGISTAMRQLESKLVRLLNYPCTPILFYGESGVGKEVAARYLHTLQCPELPFEAINCAAIPDTLIGSELFGHQKGAFTGAVNQHIGLFERAADGFVLLDEIGDMPLDLQPVLLRVLEERQFVRLGGGNPLPVKARTLFATHQNLKQQVLDQSFREDLYYRINVIQIEIPPLRERREDIGWLAERFVHQHNHENQHQNKRLSAEAHAYLEQQDWPGNVRELLNTVRRACIMSSNEILQIDDIGFADDEISVVTEQPLEHYLEKDERSYIIRMLHKHQLRIAETAEALGISRKGLWQKMKRLDINKETL